jgi:Endonuclease NucS
MAIWRMTDDGPVPLRFGSLDLERRLEDMIVQDPSLTGMDLLVVGRQVHTEFGGNVDVVASDAEGRVHVLELKRDRTPRDAVAQVLDYGSWAQELTLEDVAAIYAEQNVGSFDEAFAKRFGSPVPDLFNADQQLTLVASELDPASDRIVA